MTTAVVQVVWRPPYTLYGSRSTYYSTAAEQ